MHHIIKHQQSITYNLHQQSPLPCNHHSNSPYSFNTPYTTSVSKPEHNHTNLKPSHSTVLPTLYLTAAAILHFPQPKPPYPTSTNLVAYHFSGIYTPDSPHTSVIHNLFIAYITTSYNQFPTSTLLPHHQTLLLNTALYFTSPTPSVHTNYKLFQLLTTVSVAKSPASSHIKYFTALP